MKDDANGGRINRIPLQEASDPFNVRVRRFCEDESGAVTVDMVGLMGASVMLGVATLNVVSPGIEDLSNDTRDHLSGIQIATTFEARDSAYGGASSSVTSSDDTSASTSEDSSSDDSADDSSSDDSSSDDSSSDNSSSDDSSSDDSSSVSDAFSFDDGGDDGTEVADSSSDSDSDSGTAAGGGSGDGGKSKSKSKSKGKSKSKSKSKGSKTAALDLYLDGDAAPTMFG